MIPKLSLFLLVFAAVVAPPSWAWAPLPTVGPRAVVVAAHPAAAEAGRALLAAGGSVIDAAIGVSLALAVVEPWSSGLGGGAFAVTHVAGVTRTTDMRETAPARATETMFQDAGGHVIPERSTLGAQAAAIPGLVRGLADLHAHGGRLPWATLVAPAIALARDGFLVTPKLHAAITQVAPKMNDAARAIFMKNGVIPEIGERLIQEDLAETLERIAASGGEDFYIGETARRLVAAVQAGGGLWTAEDLAGYRVVARPPVRGRYRGLDVVSMGPPSSGGLLLIQMLQVLEKLGDPAPWNGAKRLHTLAEVMTRAFALRALGLGDPDFVPVDRARFIGSAVIERLAREVRAARRATPARRLSKLHVVGPERPDTTHFAVVTASGDGVAMTQTINLWFGNAAVAAGTGVVLNDEMDDFAAAVGVPNAFGLVGDRGNAVAPGKRPLSSMTPTLVLKGGAVVGAFGSPGGSRIITTTLQTLIHIVDDGFTSAEAVAAWRVHHQWAPDELQVERRALAPETRAALERLGHRVVDVAPMGNAMVIWRDADGRLTGAADPRGEGSALGW